MQKKIAEDFGVNPASLSAWFKNRASIYKAAGECQAALVTGVKARRLAKKRTLFNGSEIHDDLKPLTDHMSQQCKDRLTILSLHLLHSYLIPAPFTYTYIHNNPQHPSPYFEGPDLRKQCFACKTNVSAGPYHRKHKAKQINVHIF